MTETPPNDNAETISTGATATTRSRPTKALPTDRVVLAKQLNILRAYATKSGEDRVPVTGKDVAGIVGMNASTISLCNPFFLENEFLDKGKGGFLPAQEVREFTAMFRFDEDKAARKLAPLIKRSWFGFVVLPLVSIHPKPVYELVGELATKAGADTSHKPKLEMLIDMLIICDLVQRDGDNIAQAASLPGEQLAPPLPSPPMSTGPPILPKGPSVENGITFSFSMKVDMAEIGNWERDRISAFFDGLSKIAAAKSGEGWNDIG